jgi:glycosyltransferase involved in cell wall biosynthesis
MTIHDVTFIKYPEFVTSIVRGYSDRVRRCLQWTDLVIANSESTKRDIMEYFDVPEERIRVTLLASRYSSTIDIPSIDLPNLDKPYFLFVSTLEPRKNVVTVIKAFDYLKTKYKLEHRLLLAGKKGWRYEPIFEAIAASPFRESIVHLDYLPDTAIVGYYRSAELLIYPSIYEGFGLPVLEAMTLGCPVVTSNTSSLPEIAKDAAVLVNPSDPLEIAEGMIRIVSDSELRKDLIHKGEQRAREFSWQRTARETLEAYRSLL